MSDHPLTLCDELALSHQHHSAYINSRGGGWSSQWVCPRCGKVRRYLRNYVTTKQVRCDGIIHVAGRKRRSSPVATLTTEGTET